MPILWLLLLALAPLEAQRAQRAPAGVPGDAAAGRALFEGRGECLGCHTLEGKGGSLGPELSEIGIHRTTDSLRLALLDPSAEMYREYLTVVVTNRGGKETEGLSLNEDDLSIQLRDREGGIHSILKQDIRGIRREGRSLMPSYARRFTPTELTDLIAYLRSLRGDVPSGPVKYTRRLLTGPVSQDLEFLNRIERPAEERPDSLINALQISPGAAIADVGSGTGYFTWRLAKQTGPTGSVTAVDIQETMLERTRATVAERGNSDRVRYVLGQEDDPKLTADSMDLIFVANSYHEFTNPQAMVRALHRALRSEGRLVIVEFAEEVPTPDVEDSAKMSLPDLRAEIEPLGFDLDYVVDFLPLQHGLIFRLRKPQ